MEAKLAWAAVTAVAPVSWGVTYYVTRHVPPIDAPLWGSALRALPAGLGLLAVGRRRPRGAWWWRSAALGALNVGGFFVLVYIAAQQLPTSIAASVMALAPLALAGLGWLLLHEHPTAWMLTGAALGIGGVLTDRPCRADLGQCPRGYRIAGRIGHLVARRGPDQTMGRRDPCSRHHLLAILFGGAVLLVAAVAVEGPPPRLGTSEIAGFGFVSLIATAVAFGCWFSGLARLPAGMVGTIGLLNPVTGALVGTLAAGESRPHPNRRDRPRAPRHLDRAHCPAPWGSSDQLPHGPSGPSLR